MFPTETYRKRRQDLMDSVSSGLILLMGNEESAMNYTANVYPFRQDSSFLYFVGIDQPGLALIMDLDAGRTILFGTEITMDDIVWTGPQPSLADRAARSGITETKPYQELPALLAEANAGGRFVHILPPYRPENKVKLSAWLNVSFRQLHKLPSAALIKAVVALRSVKEPAEIQQMEHAVDISRAMHIAAMEQARPGMRESQLVGIVQGIATASGNGTAYPVIMTTQGQVLHNHHHHRILQSGQLVLGDFGGATNMHYAGDITRTFPVDPTFSTRQKDIYEAVLGAQMEVIEAIKPGMYNRDLHKMAALSMAKSLKDLGLMKGDMEEAVEVGAAYLFFPHGLGHMIGLDVHDMEDLGEHYVGYADELTRSDMFGIKALRLGRKLQPGFVITVEPGLYFIPELIDQWAADHKHEDFINYQALAAFRDFSGVRIEDDILVTETGYRVLGEPIPKTVREVESIRQQVLTS